MGLFDARAALRLVAEVDAPFGSGLAGSGARKEDS